MTRSLRQPSTNNAGPRTGPIVISDIMYAPANGVEYVKLENLGTNAVPLFDPARPANSWKLAGLNFVFPTNTQMAADSVLVLTTTNTVAFRAAYPVPPGLAVLEVLGGSLQDNGEKLELQKPYPSDTNGVFISMDTVRYSDLAPWPAYAFGTGLSLHRHPANAYGNEPTNWVAAAPAPGSASDSDGDGLPDWWEITNGTNPLVPDANADPDHDGHTNGQEFTAGTNPRDPNSVLRLSITASSAVTLTFNARADVGYTLQFRELLQAGAWGSITNIAPAATNRLLTLPLAPANVRGFFRLVTPP